MRGRYVAVWGLVVAFWASTGALGQEIVREGKMEKLVIASGADAEAWGAEEGTMTSTTERIKTGASALCFHIEVDYHAGEKAYPIGWPRTNRPFNEDWRRDWSGFDCLRLWIYADTSREKLPGTPLGMILYTPDKAHSYHYSPKLQKGEWTKIEIPVSKVPRHEDVTRVQFFISESNYRDHDVVDFFIDDICLLRHAEPHLSDLALRPSVAFADAEHVAVSFRALGIAEGETAIVRAALVANGKELLHVDKPVGRGANELALSLEGIGAPSGMYTVRVELAGGETQERTLRIVESPWAE